MQTPPLRLRVSEMRHLPLAHRHHWHTDIPGNRMAPASLTWHLQAERETPTSPDKETGKPRADLHLSSPPIQRLAPLDRRMIRDTAKGHTNIQGRETALHPKAEKLAPFTCLYTLHGEMASTSPGQTLAPGTSHTMRLGPKKRERRDTTIGHPKRQGTEAPLNPWAERLASYTSHLHTHLPGRETGTSQAEACTWHLQYRETGTSRQRERETRHH